MLPPRWTAHRDSALLWAPHRHHRAPNCVPSCAAKDPAEWRDAGCVGKDDRAAGGRWALGGWALGGRWAGAGRKEGGREVADRPLTGAWRRARGDGRVGTALNVLSQPCSTSSLSRTQGVFAMRASCPRTAPRPPRTGSRPSWGLPPFESDTLCAPKPWEVAQRDSGPESPWARLV